MASTDPQTLGRYADRALAKPVSRSPIAVAGPERVVGGWLVSGRRSEAALTLRDLTPLAKVVVRAPVGGDMARQLGVRHGRAEAQAWSLGAHEPAGNPDGLDVLVAGSGPGEWTILGGSGLGSAVVDRLLTRQAPTAELVSVLDLTHGRALVRLSGASAADLLAKECAVDLSPRACPDGTVLRTSVARLATDVVRSDVRAGSEETALSYLLHCERSSGQYLFDALLDAGAEFGVDVGSFSGLWDPAQVGPADAAVNQTEEREKL
jgi:heterotetrameric sarcosine oxidase gamma subunit